MKSSVAETVCRFLERSLDLPFTIYCDDSRLVSWNLAFYVRERDAGAAREHAKAMVDRLDGARITSDNGTEIYCEAATLPQFIDTDAKNFTTYSAAITASYSEEGDADAFPFD